MVAEDHLEEVDTDEEPVGNEQADFEDEEYEQTEEEIAKGKAKSNEQPEWRGFPGFSQDEECNEESEYVEEELRSLSGSSETDFTVGYNQFFVFLGYRN